MAKARVKLNSKGIRDLLRSAEVKADVDARAERIADAAGPGYEASSATGKNRARASVSTTTYAAMADNARNNTLIRNLDRGR